MLHRDKKIPIIKAVIILCKKKRMLYCFLDYRLSVFALSLGILLLGYLSVYKSPVLFQLPAI